MKYNSLIKVLVIVFSIAYGIVVFLLIGFLAVKRIDWSTALTTFASCTVELILLYALNNALKRIEVMENQLNKIKRNDASQAVSDEYDYDELLNELQTDDACEKDPTGMSENINNNNVQ